METSQAAAGIRTHNLSGMRCRSSRRATHTRGQEAKGLLQKSKFYRFSKKFEIKKRGGVRDGGTTTLISRNTSLDRGQLSGSAFLLSAVITYGSLSVSPLIADTIYSASGLGESTDILKTRDHLWLDCVFWRLSCSYP